MVSQKDYYAVQNAHHNLEIIVVAENIRTPENLGMILRVSEAFAVNRIFFVGTKGVSFTTRAKRAARNTHTLNNFEFLENGESLLAEFKKDEAEVIALEITEASEPINKVAIDSNRRLILLIGSERQGISEPLLKMVNRSVHIQMYGLNSSINVTNALSIALHQLITNNS